LRNVLERGPRLFGLLGREIAEAEPVTSLLLSRRIQPGRGAREGLGRVPILAARVVEAPEHERGLAALADPAVLGLEAAKGNEQALGRIRLEQRVQLGAGRGSRRRETERNEKHGHPRADGPTTKATAWNGSAAIGTAEARVCVCREDRG